MLVRARGHSESAAGLSGADCAGVGELGRGFVHQYRCGQTGEIELLLWWW